MKYSELISSKIELKPFNIPTEMAVILIGQEKLFNKMVSAGWIKPVVDKNRCRLWSYEDVKTCAFRLKNGEYPEN